MKNRIAVWVRNCPISRLKLIAMLSVLLKLKYFSILSSDIYVIYRLRGPDEKNCARGLDDFKTEGTVFLIRTDAAGK